MSIEKELYSIYIILSHIAQTYRHSLHYDTNTETVPTTSLLVFLQTLPTEYVGDRDIFDEP